MTKHPRPNLNHIEQTMEKVLAAGTYIPDESVSSFVIELEGIASMIAALVRDDPSRAVALYETYLAVCDMKAEEIDDSCGMFGQFVGELSCGWIEARQANRADPDETAGRLLNWMDKDDYGFFHQLEKEAAKVFDSSTLAAFTSLVRSRFDAAIESAENQDGRIPERSAYTRRRCGDILRTLYAANQDVAAYLSLAEQTGLTDEDCLVIATLLLKTDKPQKALNWIERGLDMAQQSSSGFMHRYELDKLKQEVLVKLGRREEVIDDAWLTFNHSPSIAGYRSLMTYVSEPDRAAWHERAIHAAMSASLQSAMEILLETGESEKLALIVGRSSDHALEALSHYLTAAAAEILENQDLFLAGRLWQAQGFRIVEAGKARYYDAALRDFERAWSCFDQCGRIDDWRLTVHRVRINHSRKSSFMPGFERLVEGMGPSSEPSYLERARLRWQEKEQGHV